MSKVNLLLMLAGMALAVAAIAEQKVVKPSPMTFPAERNSY